MGGIKTAGTTPFFDGRNSSRFCLTEHISQSHRRNGRAQSFLVGQQMDWVVRCWRRSDRSIDGGESEPEMNILRRKKKKKTNWLGVCVHPADQSRVYREQQSFISRGGHAPAWYSVGQRLSPLLSLFSQLIETGCFCTGTELDTCVHSTRPLVASIADSFISQFSSPVGSQGSSSSPLYNIHAAAAAVTAQHPRPINTTRRQFQRVCVCLYIRTARVFFFTQGESI
jgi:hypothetical protein